MEEFKINSIADKLKPFLSEEVHIKKVTKDSRAAVVESMNVNGVSPQEHSEAMQIIQFTTRNKMDIKMLSLTTTILISR